MFPFLFFTYKVILMEFCKYCNIADYASLCTCKINDDICPYTRRCSIDMCYKPNHMENCLLRKEGYKLKPNEYKVKFCIHDNLFVDIDDMTIEIANPYDYVPETVTLYNGENGYQFEPYTKEKKSTYKFKVDEDKEEKVEEK